MIGKIIIAPRRVPLHGVRVGEAHDWIRCELCRSDVASGFRPGSWRDRNLTAIERCDLVSTLAAGGHTKVADEILATIDPSSSGDVYDAHRRAKLALNRARRKGE